MLKLPRKYLPRVSKMAKLLLIVSLLLSFPDFGYSMSMDFGGFGGGTTTEDPSCTPDSPLVILDEPYQGLDAESEMKVIDALEELTRERTVFVVAHRFDTLRRASRVLVLDPGQPAQVGTHDELMASSARYQRLYELQIQNEHETSHAALGAS